MSEDNQTINKSSIWIKRLWKLFTLAFLTVIVFFASVRYGLFGDLPDATELENPKTKLASEIYTSDGNILGKMFYQEDRTNSEYANLPEHLKVALIATEDERFYGHSGIDGRAVLRAITKLGRDGGGSTITQQLAKNLFHRDEVNRTNRLIQKIKEWFLAIQIEKRYAKEEIILMYFNTVPYGRSFGIKSASKLFFNKKTQDLNIEESAVLVGMLRANTYYNPIRNPKNATRVRNVVFGQLENYSYITKAEKDSLKKLPLVTDEYYTDHNSGTATYFRSYLAKWMKQWTKKYAKETGIKYNIYDDGLKVYTTLDKKLQEYAEKAVYAHLEKLQDQFWNETKRLNRDPWYKEDENGNMVSDPDYPWRMMKRTQRYRTLKKRLKNDQDSIMLYLNKPIQMKLFSWQGDIDTLISPMDSLKYTKQILHTGFMSFEPKTGHIKAWVGGINHRHFQYDHVNKKSSRQVGSTFKPLVYARGLDDDKLQPCEKESTGPVVVEYGDGKEWMPKNSGDVPEEVTFYEGLQKSINTVTARVMKRLGPNSASVVKQTAVNMGIDESKFEPYPSICLGTMDISVFEMVGAYGTFVNEGTFVEPIFITRIEDKNGNILEEFTPKRSEAMRKQSAYIICKMLERVTMSGGTAARLRGNRFTIPAGSNIGGKTGTTQNNSDGWFMGITPNLVSGCWVGAEERNVHFRNTRYGQGANMALPIFGKYMEQVYANQEMDYGRGVFKKPDIEMTIELDCNNRPVSDSTYVPTRDINDEELF